MAAAIASFFQRYMAERADAVDEHIKSRRARIAAAALLVEVVHADGEIKAEERRALLSGVRSRFALPESEAQELLALAEQQAREAIDLYQFTALINKLFPPEQKLGLVEELWRTAYADNVLHPQEEQLIRKVGDLLHVPHMSVLAAKERIRPTKG